MYSLYFNNIICNMLLNNETNSIQFRICSLLAYVSSGTVPSTPDHELFVFLTIPAHKNLQYIVHQNNKRASAIELAQLMVFCEECRHSPPICFIFKYSMRQSAQTVTIQTSTFFKLYTQFIIFIAPLLQHFKALFYKKCRLARNKARSLHVIAMTIARLLMSI